jgi:hypothetical protein
MPNEKEWPLPGTRHPASWVHCNPALLAAGVKCDSAPRRNCSCDPIGSHDHLVDNFFLEKNKMFKAGADAAP